MGLTDLAGRTRADPTTLRRVALGLVLLVAFILRVWNLNWDEGTHQHPDERYWSIITSEISAAGPLEYFDSDASPMNPYNLEGRDTWVYGTFPLFTTKAAASFLADGPFPAGAIVTSADALGLELRTDGVDDFDAGYNANLIGRLLSALIDTGTVALVYGLGRELVDRRVGFVAATLLAFTPLHIQYAHFYGAEPWVTFFVTAGVWASLRMARGDLRIRMSALTGALMGLAMASKLIAVAALVVPAAAIAVAVAPALVATARQAWGQIRPDVESSPVAAALLAVSVVGVLATLAAWAPEVAVLVAGALLLGLATYCIWRIWLVERHAPEPALLFDDAADPPLRRIERHRERPHFHVVLWAGFSGLLVLVATALTYRILQPYSFDGVFSIDDRFTRDLDYLEGVNSGGNVPWVVQWIGRTPLLFPLESAFWWGMGPALGVAVLVGTAAAMIQVLRRQRWLFLPPLVLLAMLLGLVSQQFNPLIRYLLPGYPVAVALAGFGIVTLWDLGGRPRGSAAGTAVARGLRGAAAVGVLGTAFWGLAFVNGVYGSSHPRIDASVWMTENLPAGSAISNQIWDDALPLSVPGADPGAFELVTLDPFQADRAVDADGRSKTDLLIEGLERVDYVVEASNRVYDAVPRIPAKYPATTAYYTALFDGRLGFEQIAEFRSSPSLFGVDIPDHDAEETFTVYDHPTVTIWQKTDDFSVERARALLNPPRALSAPDVVPSDAGTNALLFRPDDQPPAGEGATFAETFTDTGPTATLTWLWWFMWLQLAAVAVLPWTTQLFSHLPDKGYGLSKVLGWSTVGLGVWLTVSWDLASYDRTLTWVWFAAIAAVGLIGWARHSDRMADLSRQHGEAWLASEVVFAAVFGLALWMRSANPDLWEAYLGGEKPMELGYLTALGRAGDLPAPDPWFAGGFMNYYYFGWYLLSVPMRAMRVLPEVAFNLGVATYAAVTATVAFSVVHNLVAVSRDRWRRQRPGPVARGVVDGDHVAPIRAGLVGVILLMFVGNLDAIRLHYDRLAAANEWDGGTGIPVLGQVITFLGGTWAWITGADLGRFDFWQPSRVNRGNIDITEFPYFTFLFGDLHPHLMGMVFVGLTVAVALAYLLAARAGDAGRALWLAALLGVTTGVVRTVNTWDLPSVSIVAGGAVVLGAISRPVPALAGDQRRRSLAALIATLGIAVGLSTFGGPGGGLLIAIGAAGATALVALVAPSRIRLRILGGIGHLALVATVHVLVFWPYLANNETFETGIQRAVDESPLDDFLVHWGLFLAVGAALAVALVVDAIRRAPTDDPTPGPLPTRLWIGLRWKLTWALLAVALVVTAGLAGTGALAVSASGVVVFTALLLAESRRLEPDMGRMVATGLFALAFAVSGGVEVVTVRNDIERMNTVFKFWLQSWQYFALASGFAVWQVGRIAAERRHGTTHATTAATFEIRQSRPARGRAWAAVVAVLVLAGLAYPLLGTRTRLETRFRGIPLTLDGLAYLDHDPVIVRLDDEGNEITVHLAEDLPLISWLRHEARGTPTLVEWAGAGYDWNARMAVHTGLPTVLGWDWHQKQQRWGFQTLVDERLAAVQAFYTVPDEAAMTTFLQAHDVTYVVVGTQEHRFGTPEALAVLASHPALRSVFTNGDNVIYEVDRAALWPGVDLERLELAAGDGS